MNRGDYLLFGTGGVPKSSSPQSTPAGIERVAELGLGCMEVELVHGVNITEKMAIEVGKLAERLNVKLTAHAPYFINLNAHEPKKVADSQRRLMQAARIASLMRAESVIFHPAYYLNDAPDEVYARVTKVLKETVNNIRDEGVNILLRSETTGKASQFGSLEETLNLCVDVDGLAPCIDFAHLHARTGESNSYGEFIYILNRIATRLGWHALENLHVHVSGIEYTFKGEVSHLNLKDSDLRYVDLLKAIKDLDVKGRIICESPNLEQDALLMRDIYKAL